jgi:hypothetical protein
VTDEPVEVAVLVGRAFEWRDVLGVLKVNRGKLDLEYMRRWGADQAVSDLLERALRESGWNA